MKKIAKMKYFEPTGQKPVLEVSINDGREFFTRDVDYLVKKIGEEIIGQTDFNYANPANRSKKYHVVIIEDSELNKLEKVLQ